LKNRVRIRTKVKKPDPSRIKINIKELLGLKSAVGAKNGGVEAQKLKVKSQFSASQ
jgi:hypothetical protein